MDLSTGARKAGCVFCDIVAGETKTEIVDENYNHVAFQPLNPFRPGHLLFVPKTHIEGPQESAALTGTVTEAAVRFAQSRRWPYPNFNLIVSNGAAATQTVMHLHVHLVPRIEGDTSGWPWYGPPAGGFQVKHWD